METLTSGGVTVDSAITEAQSVVTNEAYRQAISDVNKRIVKGESLSSAFSMHKEFPFGEITFVDYNLINEATTINQMLQAVIVIESVYNGAVNYVMKRNLFGGSWDFFPDVMKKNKDGVIVQLDNISSYSWQFGSSKNAQNMRKWEIRRLSK